MILNPFKPVFRWLDSNLNAPDFEPQFVTERDDAPGVNPSDYRSVACDAIYDGYGLINPGHETLEVVVCYTVRNIQGDPNNQNDWDVAVTALQWLDPVGTNFWEQEPLRTDFMFPNYSSGIYWYETPDQTIGTREQLDEFNPDIAYDFSNGDVYLVYSNAEDNHINIRLKYRRYDRLTSSYSREYYAQTKNPPYDMTNGYDPSIDVGLITYPPGLQTLRTVAIGWTSQWGYFADGTGPQTGFHVNVTTWPTELGDMDHPTSFSLDNPELYPDGSAIKFNSAGLPSVDIAPAQNALRGACLTYTQELRPDGFGMRTQVYVVRFLGALTDLDHHIRVGPSALDDDASLIYDDGMYSSIGLWRTDNETNVRASVSYMSQHDHDNVLTFRAARVNLSTGAVENEFFADEQSQIIGNWNYSDIPFLNPGISSALVVDTGNPPFLNNYWAAWCVRTEMEPPPDIVRAAWGNTAN